MKRYRLNTLYSFLLAVVAAWVALSFGAVPAAAEDRVLLVGVGDYLQDEISDLDGIALDIGMMQNVAALMGFKKHQIKILLDGDANLANVEAAISSWLSRGVNEDDHVLFYFSGHGSQIPDENGDEDDRADEVLVTHDARVVRNADGRPTLHNVLVDDRFNQLLKTIPSKNTLVLVDACNSGTATRALQLSPKNLGESKGMPKFQYYSGMPMNTRGNFGVTEKESKDRYVAITAAQDGESAIATAKGSIFTLGLQNIIARTARDGQSIAAEELVDKVSSFVSDHVARGKIFHPQLSGNRDLAARPLRLVTAPSNGPVWQRLEEIVSRSDPLSVTANGERFRVGRKLVITVDIPESGYLNVVNVGPDDNPTVLFPNKYQQDNRVDSGKLTIPTARMNFDLQAQEPLGRSITVAFLTNEPVDLYTSSMGTRNTKGQVTDIFGTLSQFGVAQLEKAATRGNFGVVSKKEQPKIRAGKVLAEVTN